MYVTSRELTPAPGQFQQTIAFGSEIVGVMNSRYGSSMAMSTEIGGDPNKIWLTGFWESLSDYQSFQESNMADQQIMAAINMSSSFIEDMKDQIGQIIRPPGERKAFAQMHRGRVKSVNLHAGMEWAMRIGDYISELSGTEQGLVVPVTGDQYELIFVSYADSLHDLRSMVEHWSVDEGYLALFNEGVELFEPKFEVTYNRFI